MGFKFVDSANSAIIKLGEKFYSSIYYDAGAAVLSEMDFLLANYTIATNGKRCVPRRVITKTDVDTTLYLRNRADPGDTVVAPYATPNNKTLSGVAALFGIIHLADDTTPVNSTGEEIYPVMATGAGVLTDIGIAKDIILADQLLLRFVGTPQIISIMIEWDEEL